jgi:HEAT repeat protein
MRPRRLAIVALIAALIGLSCACDGPAPAVAPAVGPALAAPDAGAVAAPDMARAAPSEAEQAADAGALPAGTPSQVVLLTRAKRYALESDLDSAEALFEALSKEAVFTEAVLAGTMALAELRLEQSKDEEAFALYEALLARPDVRAYSEPLVLVGRMYAAFGKGERAVALFKDALEREPSWFFLWAELADRYEALGDKEGSTHAWGRYSEEHKRAIGRLRTKIAGPSERIRIVDALAIVEDEDSIAPLIGALQDEEPLVRERAAQALGEQGEAAGAAGRDALKAALVQDTAEPVREAARASLKLLPR